MAPLLPDRALNDVIDEGVRLGNQLWATQAGNAVASQLYSLVRRFGSRLDRRTLDSMVRRGDAYSRTGVNALGILYTEHFRHAVGLGLPEYFSSVGVDAVAYYCALREAFNGKSELEILESAKDFTYRGLRFEYDEERARTSFIDKYANRGSSAVLDYLV